MSDQEQDWIAKYRAALDSEQRRRSTAGAVIAAIRRAWQTLGLGISSKAPNALAEPLEPATPSTKKVSQREPAPAQEDRDTKAS